MRAFTRNQLPILLALALVIALTNVLRSQPPSRGTSPTVKGAAAQAFVEITGAVRNPGVHAFDHPPCLAEVLLEAHPSASLAPAVVALRSQELPTGSHVELSPYDTALRLSLMAPGKRLILGIPVNINQVDNNDLALLPGISTATARRIVAHRQATGDPFHSWDHVEAVNGVGPKTVAILRRHLTVAESQ